MVVSIYVAIVGSLRIPSGYVAVVKRGSVRYNKCFGGNTIFVIEIMFLVSYSMKKQTIKGFTIVKIIYLSSSEEDIVCAGGLILVAVMATLVGPGFEVHN